MLALEVDGVVRIWGHRVAVGVLSGFDCRPAEVVAYPGEDNDFVVTISADLQKGILELIVCEQAPLQWPTVRLEGDFEDTIIGSGHRDASILVL